MRKLKVLRWRTCTVIVLGMVLSPMFMTSKLQLVAQERAKNPEQETTRKTTSDEAAQNCPEPEQLRKNVQQLRYEVQRLQRRVAELEKDRLASAIQEQLEKEEQRGELLQLHLLEIAEKEAPLQARMDQVNQQLRPEAMQTTLAGVGSVHPEDTREDYRKRLTAEKFRLQAQLELLRQDRIRTQSSLATTDAAIQRLKQKLAEALRP